MDNQESRGPGNKSYFLKVIFQRLEANSSREIIV